MTAEGQPWRLGARPQLDALRGIAIALVLVGHLETGFLTLAGVAGVTVFFVLSGFLITAVLIEEDGTGGISLRRFATRRCIRLLPALWILLLVERFFLGWVPLRLDGETVFGAATFTSNLLLVGRVTDLPFALPLWSLAVEVQLYALWSVTMVLVLRRWPIATLLRVAVGSTAALLVWRFAGWWWFRDTLHLAYGTDMNAFAFVGGASVALAYRLGRVPTIATWLAAGALAVIVLGGAAPFMYTYGTPVVAAATALVIACSVTSPDAWERLWPLIVLGRISYSVYLWHWAVYRFVWVRGATWPRSQVIAYQLVLSLAVGAASYWLVEGPSSSWLRRRWAPAPGVPT
jgi:peptidoglycan/LPS O-acetylase OafA/YrhL